MTTKLFWKDPYSTECKAKITAIDGRKVKLDQTIFYAFSGGQESDEGTLGGIKVLSATKQGDKESIIDIEYELESDPPFAVGDEVDVTIDLQRRAALRKLHSVAHILYYFVVEKLGKLKIIGSHISPEKARMDFLYEQPLNEALIEIAAKANAFLKEDHPIVMSDDPIKPDLRWWSCGEWKMPCGGTHCKSTAELGTVELKRKNIGAGKERIEIRLV